MLSSKEEGGTKLGKKERDNLELTLKSQLHKSFYENCKAKRDGSSRKLRSMRLFLKRV